MALGRQGNRQGDLVVTWRQMPRSPGHVFYDRLQAVLIGAGFDAFAETACKPYYAAKMGAPSIPPGRYFRMHMVGYFEGIDSERGIGWRCADSLSLREFLRLRTSERVPDHSWLSKTRSRLPHEVHEEVFGWVLARIAEHGLVKGERIGVDASTMEANAALRTIVRRDSGETYREMLKRMAAESGIETPSADDLIRLDRGRKGKKLSNEGLGEQDRSRREDRQDEGRYHASGLQAGTRRRSRHRRCRRGGDSPGGRRRHDDVVRHGAGGRGEPGESRSHADNRPSPPNSSPTKATTPARC